MNVNEVFVAGKGRAGRVPTDLGVGVISEKRWKKIKRRWNSACQVGG